MKSARHREKKLEYASESSKEFFMSPRKWSARGSNTKNFKKFLTTRDFYMFQKKETISILENTTQEDNEKYNFKILGIVFFLPYKTANHCINETHRRSNQDFIRHIIFEDKILMIYMCKSFIRLMCLGKGFK